MLHSSPKRIAVIGGGAAGLACAARVAYLARQRGVFVEVTLFERDAKVGRPILRSGNGRCNLSNAQLDVSAYHNAAFVADVLDAAQASCADEVSLCEPILGKVPADLAFFANRGLLFREEGEGRLYPYPNKAQSVLDLLRRALDAHGVGVNVDTCVRKIVVRADACGRSDAACRFALHLDDDRVQHFDAVIVAVGGEGAAGVVSAIDMEGAASSAAAKLVEFVGARPVLCPLAVSSKVVRRLDNIRVKCSVALRRAGALVAEEHGEVLFRKYGVSGIAVFNLSRVAEPGDMLCVDLTPDFSEAEMVGLLQGRIDAMQHAFGHASGVSNVEALDGLLLPLVAEAVLQEAGIAPDAPASDFARLAHAVKSFELVVEGLAEADKAQVRRGGVSVDSVNPATLELRSVPGAFVVGEALDVDGPCGGYNLHFAWMSGLLAADSALDLLCALSPCAEPAR